MSEFAPTPVHGAAYKALLERIDVGNCSTRAHFVALVEKLTAVLKWADGQPAEVQAAYKWAANNIKTGAEARLKLFENSARVLAAYDTIPKPPA